MYREVCVDPRGNARDRAHVLPLSEPSAPPAHARHAYCLLTIAQALFGMCPTLFVMIPMRLLARVLWRQDFLCLVSAGGHSRCGGAVHWEHS
jgi:hypothetical protein